MTGDIEPPWVDIEFRPESIDDFDGELHPYPGPVAVGLRHHHETGPRGLVFRLHEDEIWEISGEWQPIISPDHGGTVQEDDNRISLGRIVVPRDEEAIGERVGSIGVSAVFEVVDGLGQAARTKDQQRKTNEVSRNPLTRTLGQSLREVKKRLQPSA